MSQIPFILRKRILFASENKIIIFYVNKNIGMWTNTFIDIKINSF